jgi:hypothetical protein
VTILVPKKQSINVGLFILGLQIKSVSVNGNPTKYIVRDPLSTGDTQNEGTSGAEEGDSIATSTRGMLDNLGPNQFFHKDKAVQPPTIV